MADTHTWNWDFFLAHAGADKPAAEELYTLLSTGSNSIFLDSKCLLLGDDWDTKISKAQRESRISVVLISSRTDIAYYQREEIAAAIAMARRDEDTHRVVPIYLEGWPDEQSTHIPYGLRLKHGLSLPNVGGMIAVAEKLMQLLAQLNGQPIASVKVSGNSTTNPQPSSSAAQPQAQFTTNVSGQAQVGNIVNAHQSPITINQTQQQAPPSITSLHQLPSPPADFTGREAELAELMSKIEQGGVTISGLRGMGVIGKTALALKIAHKLKGQYPDAQFYLDLRGAAEQQALSVAEIMTHVIRAYYPDSKLPDNQDQLSAIYRSVFEGKRALLLMDNARDDKQVKPLIPPTPCVLLVTSRQHFNLPGLYAKDLDTLPSDDARSLLLRICSRIGQYADEIAKLCGYLPLALRLAGDAMVKKVTITQSDWLKHKSD